MSTVDKQGVVALVIFLAHHSHMAQNLQGLTLTITT